MYFFFHLFAGIILGFLIGDLLHDKRWIVPCALGSVLPDLIDKPVGFIIFGGIIGNGRIWFHALLIVGIMVAVGLLVWKRYTSPVLIAAATGTLLHQLLDLMWRQPVTWYYPLLGPFKGKFPPGHLFTLLMRELSNPAEWILAALIGIIIANFLNPARTTAIVRRHPELISGILFASALLLLAVSGIILGYGLVKKSLPYLGWTRPEEYFFGGIVIAGASYLLWRWKVKYSSEITGYR